MGNKIEKIVSDKPRDTLTINLFGPGMTVLHKVGLAGLWMTLEALEKENNGLSSFPDGSGSWKRNKESVSLHWNENPEAFFKTLFIKSFRIDKNGLLWLPALGNPSDNLMHAHAAILQEAVLGSFLQHGKTRKSDSSQKPGGLLSFQIDDSGYQLKFHRIFHYAHQDAGFKTTVTNPIAGWLFPGGAVRHSGLGQDMTSLEESPGRSLALRFAIAGVIYFKINSRTVGVRPRFCLVLPEVNDLEQYARARRIFVTYGIDELQTAGIADAGLRVLTQLEATGLLKDLRLSTCRVISFGTMPWSSQQKTRVGLRTVSIGSPSDLRAFIFCRQLFRTKLIRTKNGDPFWDTPQMLDIVAKNLITGRKWWEGFADEVDDKVSREHIFNYEKGGLADMIEKKEVFPEGPERTFVLACHEAWRQRMRQIGEKAKHEGSIFGNKVDQERERTRVAFSRCKNASSLREAVVDFWSRSGSSIKPLQEGWHDVLTLMDETNWKKGRDLALLALASYKPANKEEETALTNIKTKGDE
jgi:CRISPR-associated protein Cas8a1/Csx13